MNSYKRVMDSLNLKKPDMVPVFENIIDPKVIEELLGENNIFKFIKEVNLDGITVSANYGRKYIKKNIFID